MRRALLPLLLLLLPAAARAQTAGMARIANSKHDFRASSAATIKATDFDQTCAFCHTPHRARPAVPLWNHSVTEGTTYQVYQSTTLQAAAQQPSSGSRLCLSCHDGTLALGDTVNNGQILFQNLPPEQKLPESSPSNLAGSGLSLSGDHPFGLLPDLRNTQIRNPAPGDAVKLDSDGTLQCRTCHDPHVEDLDPTTRRFLVKRNSASELCLTCHDLKGGAGANLWSWDGAAGRPSSHQNSPAAYTAATNGGVSWLGAHTGYNTVMANGCSSCHRPHTAKIEPQLLKGTTDQVCFQCHDGNTVTGLSDLRSQFTAKLYTHPSQGPQPAHDPAERPEQISGRHAACDDCHNPHAARADLATAAPPQLPAALVGVSGITDSGSPRDPRRGTGDAQQEFELCLKCHSYNSDQPQIPGYSAYGQQPNRQIRSIDLRQALTSPASFHPVARARGLTTGPTGEVPSLLTAPADGGGAPLLGRSLSSVSQIYCSDCHNNDTGRNLGASYSDPQGPHGSSYAHLLERNYLIETPDRPAGGTRNIPYSRSSYELCFKCHSETSLQNDESFSEHDGHMRIATCSTCHDPHGVPNGSATENSHLINFDLNVVAPASNGQLRYTDTGFRSGTCSLRCHGKDHSNTNYN